MKINRLDSTDKIYYMRAILGIIAGLTIGAIIAPGTAQSTVLGIIILMGILFYMISYFTSKKITNNIPKSEKRKFIMNGIFPFIFLLLLFMIMMYTGLHQDLAS
ncbi:MAG: hypothetical protein WCB31_01010 [Nitrososphaeraceae archaeon]